MAIKNEQDSKINHGQSHKLKTIKTAMDTD
jgi:hypothetical protein